MLRNVRRACSRIGIVSCGRRGSKLSIAFVISAANWGANRAGPVGIPSRKSPPGGPSLRSCSPTRAGPDGLRRAHGLTLMLASADARQFRKRITETRLVSSGVNLKWTWRRPRHG